MDTLILLEKINRNGADRILLNMGYDESSINKIKTIAGRRYSVTLKRWHIPYDKTAYNAFLALNLPHNIISGTTEGIHKEKVSCHNSVHTGIDDSQSSTSALPTIDIVEATDIAERTDQKSTTVTMSGGSFRVSIPYEQADVKFIKSLYGSYWRQADKLWVMKAVIPNAQALQDRYQVWSEDAFAELLELIRQQSDPIILEMYVPPGEAGKVALRLSGHSADFTFLKRIPQRQYHAKYKRWTVPRDKNILNAIHKHYKAAGAKVINRIPNKDKAVYMKPSESNQAMLQKIVHKVGDVHTATVKKYADTLIAQSYSKNTIRVYMGEFCKFLQDPAMGDINDRTATEVNAYLSRIAETKVSDSQLNQIVSAIKFYYTKVVFCDRVMIDKLQRPRKGRRLPRVLSMSEVQRMLMALDNVKHKCMLYTLYSSGMRCNEIVALTVDDLLWDREQIFVRAAKGKKDRYVQFSVWTRMVMKDYIDAYQPQHWVFEGADKRTNYSSSSIRKVVKKAARKAGITKSVTTHMLRHSYATHIMDHGLDVRFIQTLLGHNDVKTTMIYTHVTNKSLKKIESPLDIMVRNHIKNRNNDIK